MCDGLAKGDTMTHNLHDRFIADLDTGSVYDRTTGRIYSTAARLLSVMLDIVREAEAHGKPVASPQPQPADPPRIQTYADLIEEE